MVDDEGWETRIAVAPAVSRARFAAWVKRTLDAAYVRGLTADDVERVTGVADTTWYRWRDGKGGPPKVEKVRAFAAGLDVPLQPALDALGLTDAGPSPTEPELDPDVRRVARRLADPNVSKDEKAAIRYVLRLLGR